jgi:hypothetical protein
METIFFAAAKIAFATRVGKELFGCLPKTAQLEA